MAAALRLLGFTAVVVAYVAVLGTLLSLLLSYVGRRRRVGLATLAVALVAVAAIPFLRVGPVDLTLPYPQNVLILVFLYAMLGQAWNVVAGYCGQIALGNAVFFGLGAYTSTLLLLRAHVSPWIGMAAGMAVAVLAAVVIGTPTFGLSRPVVAALARPLAGPVPQVRPWLRRSSASLGLGGHYFAIATIAVGEIVRIAFTNWPWVGGASGLSLPIMPPSLLNLAFRQKWPYYYVIFTMMALTFVTAWAIERARLGYYLRAIKADPDAARALGIPIAGYKLLAFAICAALTAAAGTFYAQYVLYIDPDSVFPLQTSILVALIPILGGVGNLWGPLTGALLLVPVSEYTRVSLGGTGRAQDLVVYGLLIVLVAVFQPAGFMGLAQRMRRTAKAGMMADAGEVS